MVECWEVCVWEVSVWGGVCVWEVSVGSECVRCVCGR